MTEKQMIIKVMKQLDEIYKLYGYNDSRLEAAYTLNQRVEQLNYMEAEQNDNK